VTSPAERAADVDELLRSYPDAVRATAAAARERLTAALPGIEEKADFSAKLISYGYGPGYKGVVCTLILSKTGVKLGLFRGAELPDPKKLMAGAGKVHRHVQLRSPADLERPGLKALLQVALKAWRARSAAAAQR
jgi:hypothetical protein